LFIINAELKQYIVHGGLESRLERPRKIITQQRDWKTYINQSNRQNQF